MISTPRYILLQHSKTKELKIQELRYDLRNTCYYRDSNIECPQSLVEAVNKVRDLNNPGEWRTVPC